MKTNQKKTIESAQNVHNRSARSYPDYPMEKQINNMKNRYGEATNFLQTFTPELQTVVARQWIRAYTGIAPTLEAVLAGYGEETAVVWLCTQLENINLFANVKGKMEEKRQRELATLILTEYSYLKVTELLLFCYRLKCARYGRFYGTVDALFISSALLQFMTERRKDLARIKVHTSPEEKKEEPSSTRMSYDEYLEWKEQKRRNNEQK